MAIDLSKLINITDATLTTGFAGSTQAGLFLDQNPIIPFNNSGQSAIQFNDLATVGAMFGTASAEYLAAQKYFASFVNNLSIPPFCYFARYVDVGTAPYTTGAALDAVNNLEALQAIAAGILTVNFDGTATATAAMDLSGISTFAGAATIVQAALITAGLTTATCVYDLELNAFIISNGVTTGTSTVNYCSAGTVTEAMELGQDDGATLSQGYGGAIAPYTRGIPLFSSDLTTLKAITAGTLVVNFNATPTTLTAINLSSDTSFSAMAATIQTKLVLQIAAGTVTYDSVTQAFTISNGDTSGTGIVTYCSDSALAAAMKIQQSSGAVLSQGSPALSVPDNLDRIAGITSNWTTFTNLFELPTSPNYSYQIAFCQWQLANPTYVYILYGTEPTLALANNQNNLAYAFVGEGLATVSPTGQISYLAQVSPQFGNVDIAASIMGACASVDYTQIAATINLAGKTFAGLVPLVTTNGAYSALLLNGFNFYGQFNSQSSTYNFTEVGSVGGQFLFLDNVLNQKWLANDIQNQLAVLIQTLKRIPNNDTGYAYIRDTVNTSMLAGLDNGVVEIGNTFSVQQTAALIQQAGYDITPQLAFAGYVIQVVPATPAERVARAPIKGTAWYTNGSAVNQINFVLSYVQ